jgi:hypothetical protein
VHVDNCTDIQTMLTSEQLLDRLRVLEEGLTERKLQTKHRLPEASMECSPLGMA